MLAILWLSIILVIEDSWLLVLKLTLLTYDCELLMIFLIIVDYIDLRMESKLNNSNTVSFPDAIFLDIF